MNVNAEYYDVTEDIVRDDCLRFYFLSTGISDVIKVVEYKLIGTLNEKQVFNLGFGDWDIELQKISDDIVSQNGDQYSVLNTVLSTIPAFFAKKPFSILMVQGSDSLPSYIERCKSSCRKKCNNVCKNSHRRIKIYKGFINKNFGQLKDAYHFMGSSSRKSGEINPIEEYYFNNDFTIVFVEKLLTLPDETSKGK